MGKTLEERIEEFTRNRCIMVDCEDEVAEANAIIKYQQEKIIALEAALKAKQVNKDTQL